MTAYIETAREALKLHRKGRTTQEIKDALGLRYAYEVHKSVNVASAEDKAQNARLTEDEITLIINVGRAVLRQLEHGNTCAPKLKYCRGMLWPRGKAYRSAKKRLAAASWDGGEGLNLLHAYNGYVCLTPAGWALFHAIEDTRKGARQ